MILYQKTFGLALIDGIGHVGFLLFEHGQPRGGFRHALEHQTLDQGCLPPIVCGGFQHQFDARLVTHEAIWSQAHGIIFKQWSAKKLEFGILTYESVS